MPSSTRILRHLLDRVEDSATGELLVPELHVEIPEGRRAELAAVAAELGERLTSVYPFVPGAGPMGADPLERLTNKTWRPSLAYIGMDGVPSVATGGNVLRPSTELKLSFRLPPGVDGHAAGAAVQRVLAADPPYGAQVTATVESAEDGWDAPPTAPWLAEAAEAASQEVFGRPFARSVGRHDPVHAMLGRRFPTRNTCSPASSDGFERPRTERVPAHRHGKGVTASVAAVLDAHTRRPT